jgi:hypothetical protein
MYSFSFLQSISFIVHETLEIYWQVFEGTSGIDNKYTTVQFTGEVTLISPETSANWSHWKLFLIDYG